LGSKLARVPEASDIKDINYDRILEIGKQFYGNAKDFTFYFVGNYDEKTLLPLIEQYIASLPNNGFKLKNKQIPYANGKVSNVFTKTMENPQNQATEIWYTKAPFTLKNSVLADVSARLLEMKYLRTIREELSAAYHAGANYGLLRDYDNKAAISISAVAQLNPEKSDIAIPYFFKGMEETVAQPNAEDLLKVKEILLKQAAVSEKNNVYWLGALSTYERMGVDTHSDYKEMVKNLKASEISDFLKNVILKSGNHFEIIMKAVKNEK